MVFMFFYPPPGCDDSNPNGIVDLAQGCGPTATLGIGTVCGSTPTELWTFPSPAAIVPQPRWGCIIVFFTVT